MLEASGHDSACHLFFHYTQNERRQWNAPFAATFFDYHTTVAAANNTTLYDSFDLRDLHERNQTEDIMNLRRPRRRALRRPTVALRGRL